MPPISLDEMRRGRTLDSLPDRIREFLEQHRGYAFTSEEVAIGIGHVAEETPRGFAESIGRWMATSQIQSILSAWAREEIVDARAVQDSRGWVQTYFAAK